MAISDNQVYTYVLNQIVATYESAYVTSSILNIVNDFPCVSIVSIDSTAISETIDLEETNRRSTFDVNVYSDESQSQAKAIMKIVRNAFKDCGYRCRLAQPIDNPNDTNIKRYVGRFTRAIGDGDSLNISNE